MIRFQKLNEMFKVINASPNIVEFEWEEDGKKIFIKRNLIYKHDDKAIGNTKSTLLKEESKNTVKEEVIHIVKSSTVGTCYIISPQDKKIFAKIGDKVKNGQILCIVEAMKVFKEILSDKDGTIKEILIENGQSVEYGQPLFKLVI